MPRLSKKAKREWDLFLDPGTGRRSYNELCRRCTRSCKQSFRAIVVACPHWGTNHTSKIDDFQIELGHKLVDMGYDLVVGNHPHVLQAMELYNDTLICYSLGNFSYGGNKNPDDKDSAIFQQTFTLVDGELTDEMDAKFIPCSLSGKKNKNN